MALTRRQKQVIDFIQRFVEEHEYSPSYEEIAAGMGLASVATVHKHVAALTHKGYLTRRFNQSRSLDVTTQYLHRKSPEEAPRLSVPLEGRIAAGRPVEAFEQNAALEFSDFLGGDETYALEVRGDSMIEDHILSGDFVLVERAREVRDGEIVVALVDGSETTLKRFYREPGGKARLQPANAAMEPIVVPLEALEIQGRVLAVLRKYR